MWSLLRKLKDLNILLSANHDQLDIYDPNQALTEELLFVLKKHKSELLTLLKNLPESYKYFEIPNASIKEHYKLSSVQKRLYFMYVLDCTSLTYNMPSLVKLEGFLDRGRFESSFKQLIQRHESLRTSFEMINDVPVQIIREEVDFEITYLESKEEEIEPIIESFCRPFVLNEAPLIRVGLIALSNDEHVLMVDMHHIITDGTSLGILIRDFMGFYNREELQELKLQYKDYAEWQQSEKQQNEAAKQKDFWLNEFSEESAVLQLPSDYVRPSVKSNEGDSLGFEISAEETKALKSLAEEEGATVFMVIMSIFNVLLSKLGNQEDIVVGIPAAGRSHADLENIIGMFVNTLPVRAYPKGSLSFREFLVQVKSKILACFQNQTYQYEQLIEQLKIERDTSRNPLFDVMLVYHNFENSTLEIPGLKIERFNSSAKISKFDITLSAFERDDQIVFDFAYCTRLFSRGTIERFIGYFKSIVSSVVSDANKEIRGIELLAEQERHLIIETFNKTRSDYPKEETLISLFDKQVDRTPENIAFTYKGEQTSYKRLQEECSRIASYLTAEKGVKTGDLVGIMLEREAYLIPCIFGILKAGAAYVPIDPQYPSERINSIIEDSQLKVLITRSSYGHSSVNLPSGLVDLDNSLSEIMARQISPSAVGLSSSDLAYVIYTSGSTGKPKGVMIEHHSVINRILWMQKAYPLKEADVLLQKTPVVFDVSVWELFWWSITGASLCILEAGGEKEPQIIIDAIERHKVTTVHFVPSMLSAFLFSLDDDFNYEALASLHQVFSSGEALRPEQVNQFGKKINKNCGTRLINLYGPTEATVDVSSYECEFKEEYRTVPIGKPIDNIQLYILNDAKGLSPIGVTGELYIGGAGVGRGYLNNKELTEEKFINNPFVAEEERIYKTGDLVKWMVDGNIEYIGRIDHQVKIRGFRIELGEIESQLNTYDEILESLVITRDREGDKYLVAYYLANEEIEAEKLILYLLDRLPGYMVPSHYIRLEKIPLTPNGKLDKKALPCPDFDLVEESAKPKNQIQRELVKIWADLLSIPENAIGVQTNFFDIGGNSLKLLMMVSQVNRQFKTEISVAKMFGYPVISLIAEFLSESSPIQSHEVETSIDDGLEQMDVTLGLFNQLPKI